jgi:hypothetical protein
MDANMEPLLEPIIEDFDNEDYDSDESEPKTSSEQMYEAMEQIQFAYIETMSIAYYDWQYACEEVKVAEDQVRDVGGQDAQDQLERAINEREAAHRFFLYCSDQLDLHQPEPSAAPTENGLIEQIPHHGGNDDGNGEGDPLGLNENQEINFDGGAGVVVVDMDNYAQFLYVFAS